MKKLLPLFVLTLLSFSVKAQNTITTDTILQLSTCAGGNVLVPFDAAGNFPIGNVFTAQLSNGFGQFTNPIDIGTSPFNLGFILATIPANTNFGILYKVRVVSSNPAVIGDPCPNTLIITQVAQLNQILATPNDTACVGDTVTLTAINPADSYAWSTGESTASIQVTQTGTFSVTTTDLLGCESDTSANIVFEVCNVGLIEKEVEISFDLFPNPSNGQVTISNLSAHFDQYDLRVLDLLGQTVYSKTNISSATHQVNLDSKGVYFIEMLEGKEKLRKKLIIR